MQSYELLGRNGAGANSTVFKCRDTRTGNIVAVKKVEGCQQNADASIRELALTRVSGHAHVVKLLEAWRGSASGATYMVLEFAETNLSRELLLNPRGLPMPRVKLVAYQLAQALEHLHSQQISHRDLKPGNILLGCGYSVKLCDFGSAHSPLLEGGAPDQGASAGITAALEGMAAGGAQGAGQGQGQPQAAASRWYCAPESLLGGAATPASDVWAFGCILAELVTGKPLLQGSEEDLDQLCCVVAMVGGLSASQEGLLRLLPHQQRQRVEEARARGPLLDRIPKVLACPALADLLRALLQPDPALRPSAQQLQQHPFFEDLRLALAHSAAKAATTAAATSAGGAASAPTPLGAQAHLPHSLGQGRDVHGHCGGGVPGSDDTSRASSGPMDVDMGGAPAQAVRSAGLALEGLSSNDEAALPCPAASPAHGDGAAAPADVQPHAAAATAGRCSLLQAASALPLGRSPFATQRAPGLGFGVGVGGGVSGGSRSLGGVQGAAPVAPAPRARVSALTASFRNRAFDGDGTYVDLMPRVQQLVERWQLPDAGALGPIARAARSASLPPARSCGDGRGGGSEGQGLPLNAGALSSMGGGASGGSSAVSTSPQTPGSGGAMAVEEPAPSGSSLRPAILSRACSTRTDGAPLLHTPIAAAAGGCAQASPGAAAAHERACSGFAPPPASAGPTPMDCTPGPGAAAATPATAVPTAAAPRDAAARAPRADASATLAMSASVGATPYMLKSAAATSSSTPSSTSGVTPVTAAQLRSRAIVNRARKQSRESSAGPGSGAALPMASSCPHHGSGAAHGSGYGNGATLLLQELAAAARPDHGARHAISGSGAASGGAAPRLGMGSTRRSFADLTELDVVAECGAEGMVVDSPDVKRRRGQGAGLGPDGGCAYGAAGRGSLPRFGSHLGPGGGSLAAECASQQGEADLGSVPEHGPFPMGVGSLGLPAGALGGRPRARHHRRSHSGSGSAVLPMGLGLGSPFKPQQYPLPLQQPQQQPAAVGGVHAGAGAAVAVAGADAFGRLASLPMAIPRESVAAGTAVSAHALAHSLSGDVAGGAVHVGRA